MTSQEFLHFDRFRFDPINDELWSENGLVALPRQLRVILHHLVLHPGELITKEELLRKVWHHPTRQKGDVLLRVHMKRLRDRLRIHSRESRIIETVKEKGYRFVAQVSSMLTEAGENRVVTSDPPRTRCSIERATEQDVSWIARIAKKRYDEITAIPLATKLAWFRANPNIFWIVRKRNGDPIGSLEVLPLKEEALRRFREGMIEEKDLSPDDIYSPQEVAKANVLYLENCMAPVSGNFLSPLAVETMLASFERIINTLGLISHDAMIYAMAVEKFYTEKGEEKPSPSKDILKALEFEPDTEKAAQGPLLYKLRLDRALGVTRIYQRLYRALGH